MADFSSCWKGTLSLKVGQDQPSRPVTYLAILALGARVRYYPHGPTYPLELKIDRRLA